MNGSIIDIYTVEVLEIRQDGSLKNHYKKRPKRFGPHLEPGML